MQSLEDMKPKIVELTSVKLELMEQIERLEYEKRSRDTLISELEVALNEQTEREAEAANFAKSRTRFCRRTTIHCSRASRIYNGLFPA
jgi:hypothetical protein